MKRLSNRPTLPERHKVLIDVQTAIRELERLYEEYQDPRLSKILDSQKRLMLLLNADEQIYQAEELEEHYINLKELPHAVRTWFLDYRDDELA